MPQLSAPQRVDDIVIHSQGPAAYAILKVNGERIGTSHNRRDAMLLACAAADTSGATVWMCIDPVLDIYTEVICP